MVQGKHPADVRVQRVDRVAPAGVASDDRAVDHGAIGRGARVAAVGCAGDDVVRQPAGQRRNAAKVDLERRNVDPADDHAVALIVDGRSVLGVLVQVRIVGVLRGRIRVHVVQRVRPRVAEQRREAPAERVAQIQVERVVVQVAVVHVGLDDAVGRRVQVGRRARRAALRVVVNPVRAGAVCQASRTDVERSCPVVVRVNVPGASTSSGRMMRSVCVPT